LQKSKSHHHKRHTPIQASNAEIYNEEGRRGEDWGGELLGIHLV